MDKEKKETLLNIALIASFLLTGFSLWLFFKDSQNKTLAASQVKELNIVHQAGHCPQRIERSCCEGNYCGEIGQCQPLEQECNGQETKSLKKCFVTQWKNPKSVLCSFCKNTNYYNQVDAQCDP